MRRLHYHLLDVFTDRAFGGNPLAVFTDGKGIPDATMQSIAKEFNLSETTFVLPPDDPQHNYRVRIFTPTIELPMAGHPTVGTTFVLAREGMIERGVDETSVTLEEGVGPIPVSIKWRNGAPDFIEMRQPLPEFGPRFEDVDAIAEILSIDPTKIRATNLPVEVVSCGVPYLLVPISDLATARQIRVRLDVLERVLKDFPTKDIFVFTQEVQFPGSSLHTRMFAPAFGVAEDPATGSANGPLGCYVVRYGVLPSDGELRFVSEQGIEMGRPSFMHIGISHTGDEISVVRVGGQCHYMGSGDLELEIE